MPIFSQIPQGVVEFKGNSPGAKRGWETRRAKMGRKPVETPQHSFGPHTGRVITAADWARLDELDRRITAQEKDLAARKAALSNPKQSFGRRVRRAIRWAIYRAVRP